MDFIRSVCGLCQALWPQPSEESSRQERHAPSSLGVGGDAGSLYSSRSDQRERNPLEEIWDGMIDLLASILDGIYAFFHPRKAQKTRFEQLKEKWFPEQVVINPNHDRATMKGQFKEMDIEDFKLILQGYYGEEYEKNKDLTSEAFIDQLSEEIKSFKIEGRDDLYTSYGLTQGDLERDLKLLPRKMFETLAERLGRELNSAQAMVEFLMEENNYYLLKAALQRG